MNELKTKTHEFNSDFCIPFAPKNQLFVRVQGSTLAEVAAVFSDSAELSELSYGGKAVPGFSKLAMMRNEGAQIFIVLE